MAPNSVKTKSRVAIIGAGAAGLAAATSLISSNCEVYIIDKWERNDYLTRPTNRKSHKDSDLAKKSRFNSTEMYSYPSELIEIPLGINLPTSMKLGGLTSVWGANIWFATPNEIGIESESESAAYLRAQELIAGVVPILGYPDANADSKTGFNNIEPFLSRRILKKISAAKKYSKNGLFLPSCLAVYKDRCISCQECLKGCPTDSIYSAETEWEKLRSLRVITPIKATAVSIQELFNKQVSVTLEDFQGIKSIINFDQVFIACGAIATSALLQRSGLFPKNVVLDDTQVFYLPIINFKHGRRNESDLTLAQAFFRNFDSAEGLHISLYESSLDIKERGSSMIGFLAKLVPNIVWENLFAGIGFLPSKYSGKILLQYQSGRSILSIENSLSTKRTLRQYIKKHTKVLAKIGFFPLYPMVRIPNVGSSYHVGSVRNIQSQPLIEENGRVIGTSNVFAVDSSALRKLPVGPITFPMIVNAFRITERVKVGEN